ncbi:MAG: acetolactate synthase large subunit [Streptosporangiaceae bacterium]|jgi:acetolactate synthase-1/2/3 large subunit|nr:acetolactate synthase large subunit [Streptosporangiaceae bacterium]
MTETSGGPRRHGGALLADLLIEHGVRHVFGVPGGQTLALYDGILDRAPMLQHVLTRDERSAAYAADSYARITGRAGVCDATVGPGAAKLPSGLAEALGASVPVVALVSDLPARLDPHRYRSAASQALDQSALLAPVTKWHATVADPVTMPALVRQAFREATSGRPGPVVLFLPQDILDGPATEITGEPAGPATSARFGRFPAFRPPPEAGDVAAAADVLRLAQRPFILAGGGIMHSGAGAELTSLAEQTSAAVGTTLSGKGVIAEDHPLSVGVTGSMGTAAAASALAEADVVLLAGTKAGGGATFSWTLPRADQAVLQLDIDPAELGRAFPLRAALLGDARPGLQALTAALAGPAAGPQQPAAAQPDRARWRARIGELTSAWRAERDSERASDAIPIAPQRVLADIEAALGPEDVLVCDASLASGWGGVYLEQRLPGRRVLCPRGQAGLGYALPAAIGVATAHPGGRTIVLTGDGALGYAAGELATVVEHGLPVTVVVLNNRSFGWIRWYQRITFGRGWEDDDFSDVAFADVARGFGLHGERVTEPARLAPALRAALSGKPALLDVVTEAWQTPIRAHRQAVQHAAEHAAGTRPAPAAGYGG